ncbi:MAG: ABC transporter [Austwickia sp.]|nr:MAG: ABC transporter [Austwickia sp.]
MSRAFAGTATLLGAQLRAGAAALITWALLMAGLVTATAWSIAALYATPEQRAAYAATAGVSPATAALNGRGYELTELGGITAYEVGFLGLIAFPVIAIHLAIRLTRHEEDEGRIELVTAARVGRLAPLAAAGLTLATTLAGFVVATALGLLTAGLPATGSWRYALGLGLFAAASAAAGLVAAEISRDARTAYGVGLFLVLVSFVRRAIVDGRGLDPSWSGPAGQLAEIRPWGPTDWHPMATFGVAALLGWGLAALVRWRRDLAGGLLAPRPGPAYGAARLGTPAGLSWRFLRAPLLGWLLGTAAWAACLGALGGQMSDIVRANPSMQAAFAVDRPEDLVTALAVLLGGLGAACFVVAAMTRWAREETSGRLGLLLASGTSRPRLWLTWVAVAALGAASILLASAAALGVSTALATGEPANIGTALGAGAALVPPVLFIGAAAGAVHALAPRATAATWLLVGWAMVVGLLAETLRLPDWARYLSPLYAAGRVPIDDPHHSALVLLTGLTIAMVAAAVLRFRARDLLAG